VELDPVTLTAAGTASRDNLTKIGTNNRLRRALKTTVALWPEQLTGLRLAAVTDMLRQLDQANNAASTAAGCRDRPSVKEQIQPALPSQISTAATPQTQGDRDARTESELGRAQSPRRLVEQGRQHLHRKRCGGRTAAAAAIRGIDRRRTFIPGFRRCSSD
jgi:hypothetical protein